MTDIKIVIDECGPMGGDCTQYMKAHFETNPTLAEFADYLCKDREWGEVRLVGKMLSPVLFEYGRFGRREIFNLAPGYDNLKERRIRLVRMVGGWTRMDYYIKIIHS